MVYYGYAGRILRIDLTKEEISVEPLDRKLIEKFIGGWGINVKLFYDTQKPKIDPFSPENPIIIGVGPLVGTLTPGAGKIIGTTRSPIYDMDGKHFVDNAVSGSSRFGIMLKNAGYDHIVISGTAKDPIYISIIDDKVDICDASHLWGGKDVYQTTDWFMDKYGNCGVISIGNAGENLVRYAMCIVDYAGTFGRFGLGAVMGSKKIKAIVVRGTKGVKVAKPKEFLKLVEEWREDAINIPLIDDWRNLGVAATWNFQAPLVREGVWEYSKWDELYGPETWLKVNKRQNSACSSCVIGCKTDYNIKDDAFDITSLTGHYLLPARVGQRLEMEDYRKAVKLLDICNRSGMCYFTTSNIVNWVTRLYEDGRISKEETGGLELKRDFKVYLDLFNAIANRDGFGDILADGWYPISNVIKENPDDFNEGTGIFKGIDVIQDARFTTLSPQAFAHITNPRPHHGGLQSLYTVPKMDIDLLREDARKMGLSDEELDRVFEYTPAYGDFNVGRYAKHAEDHMAVQNSLGVCTIYSLWGFMGSRYLNVELISEIYSKVTGVEIDGKELKRCGERAFNLFKLVNIREGFSKRDECSNVWLTPRDTPDGRRTMMDYYEKREILKEDIERLLDYYYEARGWNAEGIPSKKKLRELGLG